MKDKAKPFNISKTNSIQLLFFFILACTYLSAIGNSYGNFDKEDFSCELKLTGNTIFDRNDINNNIIPHEIIKFLFNRGILNDLNLFQNQDGEYVGVIITIAPNDIDILLPDYKLKGNITIFDQEGIYTPRKHEMMWWEANKSLIYIWNVMDKNGYFVSPGMYNCVIEMEERTPSVGYENGGPKQTKRLQVGVKGAESDCGGCGTSAELAFIPPIGFKLASMARRRKTWWQKLLERFRLKRKQT